MGFLAPAFLALTALAAVPLLVHLLRRRISRTVDFPAVRYLERMEQEHSRDLKLKNRLLLLLRILAVLALALAAARPIARLAGVGHAPVAVALVVDNSMSTSAVVGGQQRLELLRAEGERLLSSLDAADRAWLVTADGRVVGGSLDAVRQALRAVKPTGGRGDLDGAVRRGIALARSGSPRAGLVALATDGQANAFGTKADSIIPVEGLPIVALVPEGTTVRNRAVLDATPTPVRWTPGGGLRVRIASPDGVPYRVMLEDRTISRGSAAPGTVARPAQADLHLSSSASGWVRGRVEIDPDELRADDLRHFAIRVAPPPTVLLRSEAGEFAAAAIATLIDERRIARASGPGPSTVTISGADAPGLALPALIVAPSDPVHIGEANRTLARLGVPWRFGAIARNSVNARTRNPDDSSSIDATQTALNGARVLLRYPLVSSAGSARSDSAISDTLATAGGAPWVVSGPGYMLVGSPIDPDATDLPIRAGFLPFLIESMSRRLGSDGMSLTATPGERLSGLSSVTGFEAPDGAVTAVTSSAAVAPQEAGVYLLRRGSERVGALVVNAEAEESDLTSTTGDRLMSRFTGRAVSAFSTGEAWRRAVLARAEGRSLLVPLVMLALLLLLLEAWFARTASAVATTPTRGAAARRAA